MNDKQVKLQEILDRAIDKKKIFGTSFCIKFRGQIWSGASGNLSTESQYFIASTTKLFITAAVLKLRSAGRLNLNDKIADYLDETTLKGLHVQNGKEFSDEITVQNLLAHTSGIPDYFQQKDKEGKSIELELTKGFDRSWSFEEAIEYSKTLKPLFEPGAKGRAHYSDTNFQLLGRIIENVTKKSLTEIFDELIYKKLVLTKTYLFSDIEDTRPKTLYYKDRELFIPKAMVSFGPDGGIVSTSEELLIFTEAFFNGAFFPQQYMDTLKVWNKIFFPMQSGIGIHRFKLPWIFNPAGQIPELIGHSGLSGTIAYHSPEKELYITGTVNQVAFPDTSFRLAVKLIQKII